MPLGIVSNRDFELERANSDGAFESVHSELNNKKIDFDEVIEPDETSEETGKLEQRASLLIPEIVPEIVTSDMINRKNVGRHSDVGNVPQSIRKIIAEESHENGNKSAKSLVTALGMSLSDTTISTYKSGNISPDNGISKQDNDLLEYINHRKGKLGKKALNKMSMALECLTEAKMTGLEAKELSGVAKDMAIIVDKMQPTKREDEKVAPVQFVIMAPQIHNESHYETVVAKDNY